MVRMTARPLAFNILIFIRMDGYAKMFLTTQIPAVSIFVFSCFSDFLQGLDWLNSTLYDHIAISNILSQCLNEHEANIKAIDQYILTSDFPTEQGNDTEFQHLLINDSSFAEHVLNRLS